MSSIRCQPCISFLGVGGLRFETSQSNKGRSDWWGRRDGEIRVAN